MTEELSHPLSSISTDLLAILVFLKQGSKTLTETICQGGEIWRRKWCLFSSLARIHIWGWEAMPSLQLFRSCFSIHFYRFFTLLIKYRLLSILRGKRMKFTVMHMIHRSPTHADSEKCPELQWNSSMFFFFFFSCNTVDIPKILVTYNLSLRLSIHWPHFWDSWAAHSTASLPPCCRKISMSSPFDRVEVTDFLVGCTMISLETRTARTAKLVLKS